MLNIGDIIEKICLDTEIAIDFLKGEAAAVEKLRYYADREEICINTLTLVQLLSAIKKQEIANTLINSVTILDLDKKSANLAARLIQDSKENGHNHKHMDSIITAAICISNNAFLFTKDRKKFEGMKGLKLV